MNRKGKRGRKAYLRTKIGFSWSTKIPERRGQRAQFAHNANIEGAAREASTPTEAWSILFTEEILNIILTRKNEEMTLKVEKMRENNEPLQTYHRELDIVELKAFIWLLYFAGLYKVNKRQTRDL